MRKLLFLTPYPIESASERHRVYQFLPYLERAGFGCTVLPFAGRKLFQAIQEDRTAPKLLCTPVCYLRRMLQLATMPQYNAVVVHRGVFPIPWPAMEKMLVQGRNKAVFDFDDALHIGHRDTGTTKYSWAYRLRYGPRVNEMLRRSVHVIAGNRTLAEHAQRFNSHVSIIPTVIDLEQYAYQPPREHADTLTIGWVGSRSTSPYLLEIERALRRLSEAQPGKIRFRIYGHPQRKLNLSNFESLPFSLTGEMENLQSIDIGLMPMPDNDWTRGKCAFKAIQYMAAGIPTVCSPVGMAAEVVQHNVNGLLARTPEEWFEALNRLVLDWQLRRRLAEQGRKSVETRYSLQTWGPRFVSLMQDVVLGKEVALVRAMAAAD